MFALIMAYIWWLRFPYPYSWLPMLLLMFASHVWRVETLRRSDSSGASPRAI